MFGTLSPRYRRLLAFVAALILLTLVTWLDRSTGSEIGFSVFYLFPVVLAAALGTSWMGIVMALAAGAAWYAANGPLAVHGQTALAHSWNLLMEIGVFIVTAVAVSIARINREDLERRVDERTVSLRQEIAERRKAEDELRRSMTQLSERSAQVHALGVALTQAEERERKRIAQLIHDDLQQALVAAGLKLAVTARATADSAARKSIEEVQDLLDKSVKTSRTLVGELCPPELQSSGLVAALRKLADHKNEAHGLRVKVEADAEVPPDREGVCVLVYQVVRECLFNIAKHARVDHAVVRVTQPNPLAIRVVIEDSGVGFDPATASGGTGLGLASARDRIRLVGGEWDLWSAPGLGTRVTITVPVAAQAPSAAIAPAGAQHPEPVVRTPETPIRVVVVDDNENLRLMYFALLRGEADIHIVGQAPNGAEAVSLVQSARPEVVLMDISMPVMDGPEATRRILAQWPTVRVIGLSAYGDSSEADAMRAAGAHACITKESSVEALLGAIRGLWPSPAPA